MVATAVAGVFASGLVVPATPALADPDAVARAQEDLARIEAESSAIDARYIQLQDQLDTATRNLGLASADLAGQKSRVDALARDLGQFAVIRYQTTGVDVTTSLLTSPDEAHFLNELARMQSVTDRANDRVQSLQLAQADLAVTQQNAADARRQIAADKAEQAKVAQEYRAKEAEAQKVLERLTEEEKERLAEIERKKEAERLAKQKAAVEAARAAQEEADRQRDEDLASQADEGQDDEGQDDEGQSDESSSENRKDDKSSPSPSPSASGTGRASSAVSMAMSQVGKSYVMGATGPSAYDCSGLMLRAWGSAGVSLPRTSQAQYGAGSPVSTGNLKPGDLVFYYSGISHVGMYIGDGMIVHAANPRTGVKVSPLNSMPLMGARRVG
ncbi:NlpC/P60 family protein [Luteococcus sp. Sow4_B9]|uniref:C40 family peptidase n=1 Tax=Luteococcus sp. Sow4_B9 TaxID=3438792 RepID=UPI003F949BE6